MEKVVPKQGDITKELNVTYKTSDNRLQDQIAASMYMWVFFLDNIEKVIWEISAFKIVERKATLILMKSPSMDDLRAMYRLSTGLERIFGANLRFCLKELAIIL